ncbi:hypothetical protein Mal15_30100 [Stieleria maiorica]|uniref:Uncharacterized protein n=1 Tax=Stieleria maiorica TaxID=2795974 RepID=A0A5B9MCJ5_9BACT|nr:hypothetical protein [Stieleria maiorica]QEF98952.1 hypothetical protein Mal15_30100 [Stieleria maiorica]
MLHLIKLFKLGGAMQYTEIDLDEHVQLMICENCTLNVDLGWL